MGKHRNRAKPENKNSHENHGVQAEGGQELVFGGLPRPPGPTRGRQQALEVEVSPSLSLSFGNQARRVDADIAGLLPEHRVEGEEREAEAEIDPDGGQQRRENHFLVFLFFVSWSCLGSEKAKEKGSKKGRCGTAGENEKRTASQIF